MPASKKELGRSGLNFSSGAVHEELLTDLQGTQGIKIYKEMSDNDPVIGTMLFAIDMLMRQVEWDVEPHENGNEDEPEFLKGCMNDMSVSWSDFISEVLSMLIYGWSFFEIVYKERDGFKKEGSRKPSSNFDDGKVGWAKFAIRAQSSLTQWKFDYNGNVTDFVQRAAPDYEERVIPMQKGLLFRTTTSKNNPEGRSMLRTAYRPWYYKKRFEEVEGTGIERDLAGLPMVEVDSDIMTSENSDDMAFMASIRTLIQNVRQDKEAGIIFPLIIHPETGQKMAEFSLLTSGGSRSFDLGSVIQRLDSRIAMTTLADFVLLGHQGGTTSGSYALSSDKTNLFAQAIGAWLGAVEDVINRFAVQRLWRMNGFDVATAPRIVHKDIESPNLVELATFLQNMAQMGMKLFPDENLEQHIRTLAKLPPEDEDKEEENEEDELSELVALLGAQLGQGGAGEQSSQGGGESSGTPEQTEEPQDTDTEEQ